MYQFTDPDMNVFSRSFGVTVASEPGKSIFESASQDPDDFAEKQLRAMAMSTALVWLDEKDFTFDAVNALVIGMVDADGDDEISDDEEEDYNNLLEGTGEALIRLGASRENVMAFMDDEDDAQGAKLGSYLVKKLDGISIDDNQLITRYATSVESDAILESTIKVVRDGKLTLKKKRIKKYKMSSAQRQALKKARRKSNSSAARRGRAKAMRIRKKRGI